MKKLKRIDSAAGSDFSTSRLFTGGGYGDGLG